MPNLVDIQLSSYERFLQREPLAAGQGPGRQGLEEVFQEIFPIESPNGDMVLEYVGYSLDESGIKLTEQECKHKGLSFVIPIKAKINLVFWGTGEIRQKEIYMGDIPLMTGRGTFIINGAERVVVSQIHRSPGVIFSHEKGAYTSRIIPYRGSWLEFEIDQKKELIYAKIDRKKRLLATIFLRALGFDTREKIIELFYRTKHHQDRRQHGHQGCPDRHRVCQGGIPRQRRDAQEAVRRRREDPSARRRGTASLRRRGRWRSSTSIIPSHCTVRSSSTASSVRRVQTTREDGDSDEPSKEDAIGRVYAVIKPGEPITVDSAEKDLRSMFFSERRYDLGRVGRYKLNKKFDYAAPKESHTLTPKTTSSRP